MAATGFTPRQVTAGSGGTGRFVVTGRDRLGHVVAYTSTDNGATWAQSEGFGVVPSA
jgi:Neuraminidase (sialidase)